MGAATSSCGKCCTDQQIPTKIVISKAEPAVGIIARRKSMSTPTVPLVVTSLRSESSSIQTPSDYCPPPAMYGEIPCFSQNVKKEQQATLNDEQNRPRPRLPEYQRPHQRPRLPEYQRPHQRPRLPEYERTPEYERPRLPEYERPHQPHQRPHPNDRDYLQFLRETQIAARGEEDFSEDDPTSSSESSGSPSPRCPSPQSASPRSTNASPSTPSKSTKRNETLHVDFDTNTLGPGCYLQYVPSRGVVQALWTKTYPSQAINIAFLRPTAERKIPDFKYRSSRPEELARSTQNNKAAFYQGVLGFVRLCWQHQAEFTLLEGVNEVFPLDVIRVDAKTAQLKRMSPSKAEFVNFQEDAAVAIMSPSAQIFDGVDKLPPGLFVQRAGEVVGSAVTTFTK